MIFLQIPRPPKDNYKELKDYEVFTKLISKKLHISVGNMLSYHCQDADSEFGRPDIAGYKDGVLSILCEAKFFAGDGSEKGIGAFCINWAFEQCGHLRIDTHGDNVVMQNLVKKLGFVHCGTIYVTEDNDPRLAYEKTGPAT